MASSGSVVINPDHLECGDGTVTMAMQLWSCRNEPVQYNAWQSVYFQLCKQGLTDDGAVPNETAADRQKRIRRMYEMLQTEAHGPDFKAEAAKLARAGEGVQLRPPSAAGDVSSLAEMYESLDASPGPLVVHRMDTPRRPTTPSEFSPDKLLNNASAQDVWDDEQATHTEMTDEQDQRLAKLADGLANVAGATEAGVAFILRVEQLMREYRTLYAEESASMEEEQRASFNSTKFYLEKLVEIRPSQFDLESEFKQHVYALGRLAGRRPAESREYAKSMWAQSLNASPEQGSGDQVASPLHRGSAGSPSPELETPGDRGLLRTPPTAQVASTADAIEMIERIGKSQMETFAGAMDKIVQGLGSRDAADPDIGVVPRSEKLQAISGLDFKSNLPHISDSDPDMDRYDLEFETAVACYAFGGRAVREVDKLHLYGKGFLDGSTRHPRVQKCHAEGDQKGKAPCRG